MNVVWLEFLSRVSLNKSGVRYNLGVRFCWVVC